MYIERNFLARVLPEVQLYRLGATGLVKISNDDQHILFGREVSVAIDSRRVNKGDLFFALPGARVDGHNFIEQAFESGASAIVVSRLTGLERYVLSYEDKLVILVPNTINALIALAQEWRKRLSVPIVGVTGSVGKTSTKEIIRSILHAANIPAYVSSNSENELFGLCKNLLSVRTTDQVVVCEVGINAPGEMAELVALLRPLLSVITNITYAHSAGLGSLSQIAEEKKKLFSALKSHDTGIVFGDQPILRQAPSTHQTASFGFKRHNQVYARKITFSNDHDRGIAQFDLYWFGHKIPVTCSAWHHGNIANALAAATVAYFLSIPLETIVAGIQQYQGFRQRFELKQLKVDRRKILVSDCYNANPTSMRAAIDAFDRLKVDGEKMVILGDMLELGKREKQLHSNVGRYFAKTKTIKKILLIGPRAYHIGHTAPAWLEKMYVSSWQEAQPLLENLLTLQPANVLIKGSRGMQLDKLVTIFAD